ncbi:MAG: hypothetical protein G01um101418_668 [Parcubacteria group bacterium Gr01-1014_18]|nr:MAG: hypothetical protein Greene041636_878 [Parcubacteria group bacterium Greene0416_36]TSC80249.1 MAG: hypothetical protein G01um101418_668 [Parcubacteria group bacterium Gr01-1014_18]TSC98228.1 MAG: hypothetical protein Greene101420_821 [Parcubacteria group bacterium Greene1014_20]TSD07029.1 MAG: hypothetical protein Greene07142_486 [Parcubacteria group bacterium Greene0714_2]
MENVIWKRLISLAKHSNDRVIITDGEDIYTLSRLVGDGDDKKKSIFPPPKISETPPAFTVSKSLETLPLTEEELLTKINQEILDWKRSNEKNNQSIDTFKFIK